jgi:cysteine desulfurase/selenocysteine lyase
MNQALKNKFKAIEKNPSLIYLDSAASSLKIDDSIQSMVNYFETSGANISRGAYAIGIETTHAYEASRDVVAKYIGAEKKEEIIFTKGTTQSMNMLAYHFEKTLKKGDEILSSELEHNASILPFQRVALATGATLSYVDLDEDLRIHTTNVINQISTSTKVIVLTYVSNVMGYITDLKPIIKKAHEIGAIVIVDAAQAAPHISINVKDLGCDFLAFSGHKCYGPTGVGVLYGRYDVLNQLVPFEVGGGMVDEVELHTHTYLDLPERLEAGTPPIAEVIGLAPALNYILEVSHDTILNHSKKLQQYLLEALKERSYIHVYNPKSDIGIVTFNIQDVHAHDVQSFLSENNIAVRTGHHCAKLLQKRLKTSATIRVSFQIYNDTGDIDKLLNVLDATYQFFRT